MNDCGYFVAEGRWRFNPAYPCESDSRSLLNFAFLFCKYEKRLQIFSGPIEEFQKVTGEKVWRLNSPALPCAAQRHIRMLRPKGTDVKSFSENQNILVRCCG